MLTTRTASGGFVLGQSAKPEGPGVYVLIAPIPRRLRQNQEENANLIKRTFFDVAAPPPVGAEYSVVYEMVPSRLPVSPIKLSGTGRRIPGAGRSQILPLFR